VAILGPGSQRLCMGVTSWAREATRRDNNGDRSGEEIF
jgi:hypothetical protein